MLHRYPASLHPQEYGITTGVYPIGDWTYDQLYKEEFVKIEGDTWESLINSVRQFRINVGLPLGDPASEVSDAIRIRSPMNDLRRSKSQPFSPNNHRPIPILIEKIRDWLLQVNSKQLTLESQDEADRRAQICGSCPQNISFESSCGQCNEDVAYKGNLARRSVQYHHDGILRGCRLHGILLKTAVFLQRDDLPDRHTEAPARCWL